MSRPLWPPPNPRPYYFPVPNEVFRQEISAGEFAILAFLFRIHDGLCCQVRPWQRNLYAECCHWVYYPLDSGSVRQGYWVSGTRCS